MKTIYAFVFFTMIAAFPLAAEWETYELIDRLLGIQEPCAPVVHENSVIFTASSEMGKVGIAFAHEKFANVYWFKQLMVSQDRLAPVFLPGQKYPDPYKDSGILFYVYQVPEEFLEVEYRLVVNGLWTIDPLNSQYKKDPVSGLNFSTVSIQPRPSKSNPLKGLPNGLIFTFNAPAGETVTVAGDFNGWDPFMYELKEYPAGVYSITLPLPPGKHQYVFFHRGRRFADPHNPNRVYAKDGSAASLIVVP
ncbi:MAG: isoamylase [Treponema sp.]|jgi:hypothetical protein|nr:isoamylase [Treponema sp.]